jgi:ribosomal protein L40E
MKNQMLKIKCKKCKQQLTEQGALIFSPPETHERVYKFHICMQCYFKLMDWIFPETK